MENFWDSNVWGSLLLTAVLLISLLCANALKKSIRLLRVSLIPTSVLGGMLLLILAVVFEAIAKKPLFDTAFFNYNGSQTLEIITYHCLALGFIATSFRPVQRKFTRKRNVEILNTGVTTVATYLLQGIVGMGITMIAALFIQDFFSAAGILLPFGYGQGTGQALNYGGIYENDFGFVGGKSFGLTIAALGFLSASIGGVIYLNLMRRRRPLQNGQNDNPEILSAEDVQKPDEIPMNGSIDKLTVQIAFVFGTYFLTYLVILVLGNLILSFRSILYGFNFLVGVLLATLICLILRALRKKNIVKRQYLNNFLMNRISGFFFDLMVVAGIAAIRINVLKNYWVVIIILGVVGAVITYLYNRLVAKTLFPAYAEEQFLVMYGMLTGTASTGIILLREVDVEFSTPAADNLVFQNFPAMVFGFPMMLLATLAPKEPLATLLILTLFFVAMNLLLFRSKIFRRHPKHPSSQ